MKINGVNLGNWLVLEKLLLGPMYHLFTEKDQHKVLDEAIRVTKSGGVILVAFLSVHAILYSHFLKDNFEAGLW